MKITDVKVFIRESNQLKAFVNIVIDDAFIIRNIKVIEGENGLFVAMPSRRVSSGEYRDIAHPINTETRNLNGPAFPMDQRGDRSSGSDLQSSK